MTAISSRWIGMWGAAMDVTGTLATRLREHGLKATQQRLVVAAWIFAHPRQHFTARDLHAQVMTEGHVISLASIYNILRVFDGAGLLRAIIESSGQTHYDTNPTPHHHFRDSLTGRFIDIPACEVEIAACPAPPAAYVVQAIDVVLHLRPAG